MANYSLGWAQTSQIDDDEEEAEYYEGEGIQKPANGLKEIEKDGKQGLMDSKGNLLVPCLFDYVEPEKYYNNFYVVSNKTDDDEGWRSGLYKPGEGIVLPVEYQGVNIIDFENGDGYIMVKKDWKYGVYDVEQRRLKLPIQFESLFALGNGEYICTDKYGDGIIDENDGTRYYLPESYSQYNFKDYSLGWAKDGLIPVGIDDKHGFLNTDFEEVIPVKYDQTEYFINGKCLVRLGEDYFYIDKKGNRLPDKVSWEE